jgi:acetolactate synthase I/II/III large subunit
LIERAERPLILAGGGVHLSQAYAALGMLAESQGIPVAHTMSGKGAIACTSPLSAGLFGRYDRIANHMIGESDCLIVVGCKLGEIATKRSSLIAPEQRVIHIEIDPTEIGRTTQTEVALVGDARLALEDLQAALPSGPPPGTWHMQVPERMAAWRRSASERLLSAERPINIGRLMHELNKFCPMTQSSSRTVVLPRIGVACCSTPSGPAATSSPIAASLRSAMAFQAVSARSSAPAPSGGSSRSPVTAASI